MVHLLLKVGDGVDVCSGDHQIVHVDAKGEEGAVIAVPVQCVEGAVIAAPVQCVLLGATLEPQRLPGVIEFGVLRRWSLAKPVEKPFKA